MDSAVRRASSIFCELYSISSRPPTWERARRPEGSGRVGFFEERKPVRCIRSVSAGLDRSRRTRSGAGLTSAGRAIGLLTALAVGLSVAVSARRRRRFSFFSDWAAPATAGSFLSAAFSVSGATDAASSAEPAAAESVERTRKRFLSFLGRFRRLGLASSAERPSCFALRAATDFRLRVRVLATRSRACPSLPSLAESLE